MSDINTTPLVDVMLVLLIIFLIAVPVVIQSVPVKLPDVRFDPTTTKPENVSLSIKAGPTGDCEVYWNMTKVTSQELLDRAGEKRSEEHTSELQSIMRNTYAVFCLKKKTQKKHKERM